MSDPISHIDTAPFIGRVLLATATDDEGAFFAAVLEAASEGIDSTALLVVVAQALTLHLDAANPDWAAQVRLGLLEGAS